jgi:DNA (cytosine-5)-methyltransferase 1
MAWLGVCLTAKTSESPNNAVASTLLPCIETQEVQEKYFLSQNAATGILRRVDRMKRNLPPSFRQSLEMLAKDL